MNRRITTRGALATLLLLVAAACAPDEPDGAGSADAARDESVAAVSMTGVLEPGSTVEFFANEFAFAPHELTAQAGAYTGVLINQGEVDHDIQFDNGDRVVAEPGESVEFEFIVPAEGVAFNCTISGHADAGMVGSVQTPESAAALDTETESAHGAADEALSVVEASADAPAYTLRDPKAPARGEGDGITLIAGGAPDGGDLIEVEMVVEEKLMTVAEGYEQLVWTFNGEVPGPVLRTEVGDTVRVLLSNPIGSEVPHSVDFHASQVAWNDEMRSIEPGEDLVYEFTTDYAGVWMYHCGTDPVLHHIANGMFGMVITEPAGGLPPMDNEFFFVQNEWYLGPQGEVSSFAKANQAAPAPDFVMLTAWLTSIWTIRSKFRPARTCDCSCSMSGRRSTRRSTSWAPSSTRSPRRESTSSKETKGAGARRRSTSHRHRGRSSSCEPQRTGCTRS